MNNRNTRKSYEIYWKLTIKSHQNDVNTILVSLLLGFNIFYIFFFVSIVDIE